MAAEGLCSLRTLTYPHSDVLTTHWYMVEVFLVSLLLVGRGCLAIQRPREKDGWSERVR